MRRIISIVSFLWLLTACSGQGALFLPPEFVSMEADVSGPTAVLKVTLSEDRIDRGGFILYDGETEIQLQGVLKGKNLTATAKGLELDKVYRWLAYVQAGNGEIRSEERSLVASSGAIPIPDPVFKDYLIKNYDLDADDCISVREAGMITQIELSSDKVTSLRGIEHMPFLISIVAYGSQPDKGRLLELDLSGNPELRYLYCQNNPIRSLDVSMCPHLRELNAEECELLSFSVSDKPELRILYLGCNPMFSFDLSACPQVQCLDLNNLLFSFDELPDLTHLPLMELHLSTMARQLPSDYLRIFPSLTRVNFSGYKGTAIDLSQNTCLTQVWCYDMDNITTLDLSNAPGLKGLFLTGSHQLTTVFLSRDTRLEEVEKDDWTQLVYI